MALSLLARQGLLVVLQEDWFQRSIAYLSGAGVGAWVFEESQMSQTEMYPV